MKRRIVKHIINGVELYCIEYKKYWHWESYLTHDGKTPYGEKIFADTNNNWARFTKLKESEIAGYEIADYAHSDSLMYQIPYFKRYEYAKDVLDEIISQQDHKTVIDESVVYETK